MAYIEYQDSRIRPGKIVCIGRNYAAHIEELGNAVPDSMVVFNKPASAISDKLQATHLDETLHYEGEICFLVKNGGFTAVAVGLDLTKRKLQGELKTRGLPWERAKAFDGSALFSEFVELPMAISSPLAIKVWVDGELRQSGSTEDMLYPPAAILAELGSFTRLEDGDVVMTGTPEGVGEIRPGQTFRLAVFMGDTLLVEHTWLAA